MSRIEGPGRPAHHGRARLRIAIDRRTSRRRGTPAWAIGMLVLAAIVGMPGPRARPDEPVSKAPSGGSSSRPAPKPKPTAAPPRRPPPPPRRCTTRPCPLHERIDRLIEARLARELPGQQPAAPATDAEFLRRAWLDLAGTIPAPAEARAFLDDPSPYKRRRSWTACSKVRPMPGGWSRSST